MALENGLGNLVQQAHRMQEKMHKLQEEVARVEVTGEAGAGMVRITMTGRYDVKKVDMDPELLNEDKEILEDLVAAAVNDAVRRAEKCREEKMSALTAGIPLPPGFKFPFS